MINELIIVYSFNDETKKEYISNNLPLFTNIKKNILNYYYREYVRCISPHTLLTFKRIRSCLLII